MLDPAATGSHSNHPLEPVFPEYTRTNRVQLQSEMQADSSGQLTGVIQGVPVQGSPSTPTTQQV